MNNPFPVISDNENEDENTPTMREDGRKMETVIKDIDFSVVEKVNPVLSKFLRLQEIKELGQRYAGLTITGLEDKAGYDLVRRARMDVRARRLEVERIHKDGKAEAWQVCKDWDAAKNTLLANLEPIEVGLQAKEKAIDDLIQAEKDRTQKIINDRVAARNNALIAVNAAGVIHPMDLPGMPEADFLAHLAVHTAKFEDAARVQAEKDAELKRLQSEEAERKAQAEAESKRVAEDQRIERDRLEAQARAQAEAQAKIDAQLREIEDKKRRDAESKARADELERVRVETAEKTRLETEAKAKAAAEQKIKDDAARVEREKQEAAQRLEAASDKEKLNDYLQKIRGIVLPHVKSAKHQQILLAFTNALVSFGKSI